MFAHVRGVDLFYERTGDGPPLVLLHGNGEAHDIFDEAIPLLSRDFTVYAVDSRAHGKSGKGGDPLGYGLMADDIAAFISALGLERPALYGFSDGGIIGLLVALKAPGLLGKLAISGANIRPDGLRLSFRLILRITHFFTRSDKIKMMLTQPRIAASSLAAVTIPVLVLAGSRDIIRRGHTEEIAAALPNASLKILDGETHDSYVTHTTKIYEILKGFL